MVFEKFSEWAAQFSIEDIFRGDFSSFLPLLYLAISIAIYSILIWHFYRFILFEYPAACCGWDGTTAERR